MEINLPKGENPFPPFKAGPVIIPFLILIFFLASAGSMFYQVDQDETGVVQRFGKYISSTGPGLHFKLPLGIDTVQKIKTTRVFKEEFGFRTVRAGVRTIYSGREDQSSAVRVRSVNGGSMANQFLEESLMLTGDLNTAVVEWIVQYTIKDPVQYAFRVRDPRETIRNMSEAVMRLVVGDRTIDEVLTEGREQIQYEAQDKLQEVLNDYGAGIEVRNVILQDVNPPDEVKPSFNEVNEARQEKEKLINQAWEEYNRVIPRAKGQAEKLLRESEGYQLDRVNRAKGDAERFLLTLEEYKKAPAVTKKRMYLEMAEKLFPKLQEKWFLDDSQKGLLPLLNLNQDKKEVRS
ncbi:MAG: FtsH protease activity modulator HflK [Candidatus Omnitrophica bacterium]|nr:FtsH protease activity modulator HflK [Candidatus Omnitrophota bacterium]